MYIGQCASDTMQVGYILDVLQDVNEECEKKGNDKMRMNTGKCQASSGVNRSTNGSMMEGTAAKNNEESKEKMRTIAQVRGEWNEESTKRIRYCVGC